MREAVKPRDPALLLPALRSGERSPREEAEQLLDRADVFEEQLETLLPDEEPDQRRERLLSEADELEARWPDPARRPVLYGTVVGIKDLFHVAGFPTRAGSDLPPDTFTGTKTGLSRTTAESVRLLRDAGALILGKTVSTEFAYFGPGPTRNPWNRDHTPGGSSSGSAAAVAAGFCHLALGTQTIGSITRPATYCGVAGYKPSFGRISTDGAVPFSASADHVGVIAPSVRALDAAASVLARDWKAGSRTIAAPPRDTIRHQVGTVLIPDDAYLDQAREDAHRALEAVEDRLQGIGITVQRVSVFPDIETINSAHQEMIACDFSRVHRKWFEDHGHLYHEKSRELVQQGQAVPEARYIAALEGRRVLRQRLGEILARAEADILISPATVSDAPRGLDATGSPIMNLPWTYAGLPTVSIPLAGLPHGTGTHGLPLGIQIAGAFGEDEHLLAIAVMLESVLR